jgi:pimeloyl-ACP methyl ester carboxylesterase
LPGKSKKSEKITMKWIKRIILGGVIFLLILVAGGWSSQAIFSQNETRKYLAPGQLIDVGGHKLHIHCLGAGSPTVILDTGLGLPAASFGPLQREFAKTTRVCSYDRAGYGFSEPGPLPRSSRQVVSELHALLTNAHEAGPYILVGHSLGGLNVRVFQNLFPNDVAGLILLDAAAEEILNSKVWEIFYSQFAPIESDSGLLLGRILISLGIPRFASLFAPDMMKSNAFSPEEKQATRALTISTKNLNAALNEGHVIKQVFLDAKNSCGHIDNTPLAVIAAGKLEGLELIAGSKEKADALKAEWLRFQLNLAKLSTNSKFLIAEHSGHGIPFEQPELVVETSAPMIQEFRRKHAL